MLKAFQAIDAKKCGGISPKQLLVFLNNSLDNAQIKLADIDAVYRRLKIKSRIISYVDLLNALFPVAEK